MGSCARIGETFNRFVNCTKNVFGGCRTRWGSYSLPRPLAVIRGSRAYFNVTTGTDVLGDLKSVLEGLVTRA